MAKDPHQTARFNTNASLKKHFQAMGFKIEVISNDEAIIAAAEAAFGQFGPAETTKSSDFVLRLFADKVVDDAPLEQPIFRQEGHLAYQSAGQNATLVIDQLQGFAFGYFSPKLLANQPLFRYHFIELAFYLMLSPHGFLGVHGAALAKNNKAILLRAQSGGGKTTLAYAAARRKYQALAEDVVWLDTHRHIWWGIPWTFHLLPDAKTLFPELSPYEPVLQTNQEMKLEVNLETIRSGSTTVSAQPGPVVLVERLPGGKSRLEKIDLPTAKPLWLAGFAGAELSYPNYHQHIDALLKNNSYRLYFGDDIDAGVDLLDVVFENAA